MTFVRSVTDAVGYHERGWSARARPRSAVKNAKESGLESRARLESSSTAFHLRGAMARLPPSSVFCKSMAMVMGPTPPGTGVILLATLIASL